MTWEPVPFESLKGKTLKNIIINKTEDIISFITDDKKLYIMTHRQDCCERVFIKEIDNDILSLIGSEILLAECRTNQSVIEPGDECYDENDDYSTKTWTFYTLRTMNNTCTISWYGASNGYYSETAELMLYVNKKEYKIQSLTDHFLDRTKFSKIDNQIINKFLEMIKSIPVEIHWWGWDNTNLFKKGKNDTKTQHIKFEIINPHDDIIEYKIYIDKDNSLKIDRTTCYNDPSIKKVVDEDISWPDIDFVRQFLYKYGRFE